uniref:Uncharacterized protein n=1 Tax=Tanacetum cinerariifolium TaxID=118510 RepID=A0A6L2KLB5_TANCI|nr:hypothetical protein [Tanacetum cinerariifolium]
MVENLNESRALINWGMITILFLFLQNIDMVTAEDGVANENDWGPKKDLSASNVIATVLDIEMAGLYTLRLTVTQIWASLKVGHLDVDWMC